MTLRDNNKQDNNPAMSSNTSAGGFQKDTLPTPTRFLLESGAYNFTPGLLTTMATNEVNPFEASFGPSHGVVSGHAHHRSLPVEVNREKDQNVNTKNTYGGANAQSSTSSRSNSNSSGEMQDGAVDSGDNHHIRIKRANSELSDDDDNSDKRQKFLQKNRAAASKCRQKKKVWIQDLEKTADEVCKRNEELVSSVARLREELMTLKNMLLAHRDCNCNMIQKYIHSSGQFSYLVPNSSEGIKDNNRN